MEEWCWSWKSQESDGVCMSLLCISFVWMNLTAEWHGDTVHVCRRYKFRRVDVYLVSLLEELLEHYMLFWLPQWMPALLEGEEVLHRVLKTPALRSSFPNKERWCLSNTWQASAVLTATLHDLICPHNSLKIKMSEPKKHSFNFRKWDPLAIPTLSLIFLLGPFLSPTRSAFLRPLFVLRGYTFLHHDLCSWTSILLSQGSAYISGPVWGGIVGSAFSRYKTVLICSRHHVADTCREHVFPARC